MTVALPHTAVATTSSERFKYYHPFYFYVNTMTKKVITKKLLFKKTDDPAEIKEIFEFEGFETEEEAKEWAVSLAKEMEAERKALSQRMIEVEERMEKFMRSFSSFIPKFRLPWYWPELEESEEEEE